jgi:N-hydroxyarylamine O-acetyltransferase
LGFEVTLLAARVFDADRLGPPFDHRCLRVDLDEPWLADVGFGDSFWLPLKLFDRADQLDDAGTFRVAAVGDDELDLLRDGAPQYRFDLAPHELVDYAATCAYHQTSAESHFTQSTVCSLPPPGGRVTITGTKLVVTDGAGREERALFDAELGDAYRQHFGIDLEPLPVVRTVPGST